MKSLFITFDQAHYETVTGILNRYNCRGFSFWEQVQGRGSKTGEPHYGNHAWPGMCSAIIAMVDDHIVDKLLEVLHEADVKNEQLGLRAFVWDIEKSI